MARQLGALPGRKLARHLAPQSVHPVVQFVQLAAGFLVVAGRALQLLDLFLDAFQFVLRFRSSFHIDVFSCL